MVIKDIIEKAKKDLADVKSKSRIVFNVSPEDFKELFSTYANIEIAKRDCNSEFVIDKKNKDVINQLYYYMVGSSKFNGNLQKGIFLGGTLGTGKTIIMKSFCNTWNSFGKTIISKYSSREAADLIIKGVPRFEKYEDYPQIDYLKAPMYIDDIGKEKLKVIEYGTEICPMNELLSKRYDKNALTFITGNYNVESLSNAYSKTLGDRIVEMFNILVLKGESRRK